MFIDKAQSCIPGTDPYSCAGIRQHAPYGMIRDKEGGGGVGMESFFCFACTMIENKQSVALCAHPDIAGLIGQEGNDPVVIVELLIIRREMKGIEIVLLRMCVGKSAVGGADPNPSGGVGGDGANLLDRSICGHIVFGQQQEIIQPFIIMADAAAIGTDPDAAVIVLLDAKHVIISQGEWVLVVGGIVPDRSLMGGEDKKSVAIGADPGIAIAVGHNRFDDQTCGKPGGIAESFEWCEEAIRGSFPIQTFAECAQPIVTFFILVDGAAGDMFLVVALGKKLSPLTGVGLKEVEAIIGQHPDLTCLILEKRLYGIGGGIMCQEARCGMVEEYAFFFGPHPQVVVTIVEEAGEGRKAICSQSGDRFNVPGIQVQFFQSSAAG